jgi:cytochrome c556
MPLGRPRTAAVTLALLATIATAPACGPRAPEPPLSPTRSSGLHGAQSVRLRELMHELDRLRPDRLPVELDVRGRRGRRLKELSQVAAELAAAAREIPDAAPDVVLAAGEADFRRLAATLEARANDLGQMAAAEDLPAVRVLVAEITATCDACHTLFRAPGS